MKKILISLSIIGVAGVVAIGGTIAYFSDLETSQGNTLSAGTIDLVVNNRDPFDAAVVTLYDVKPSKEIEDVLVNLRNVGTNEGIADLHIVSGSPSEGIDTEPECQAENKVWNEEERICEGEETLNENICEEIIFDYCYDSHRNWECDEEDAQGFIKPSEDVDLGILGPGTRRLWLSFHLDDEAGNEYQGDSCTFDIEFTLHQMTAKEGGE